MGLLSKALPGYSGPYKVSTTDFEIPVKSRSFGTGILVSTGEPALKLETALFTVFYPANAHKVGSKKHQQWLQRPLGQTASGYARFLNKPKWLIQVGLWAVAASTKLPAEIDVPMADRLPTAPRKGQDSSEARREMSEAVSPSTGSGSTTTLVESEDNCFPLIIFSHGLGGSRTTYSQYCGELASLGYIVAAIEHRDGSGPISVVRLGDGKERVVNYIKPEDLRFDAPNPPLSQIDHRKEQLIMRLAEIEEVLAIIRRINDGEGSAVVESNLRNLANGERDVPYWKGRIDVKNAIAAGHSFGGATTLQALRAGSKFPFVSGVALDPWLDPIPPYKPQNSSAKPSSTPTEHLDINVPLLVVNSEAFTLWSVHYRLVRDLVQGVRKAESWLMTLVGSIHLSFSDFPIIQPFLGKKAGARVDPREAMSSFVEASREFLAGEGTKGRILGQELIPGDENGTRPGEGYPQKGGKPMEPLGAMRMHVRPE